MSTIVPAHPTMSVIPLGLALPAGHSCPELYRLTVDQYEQMGRAGILSENDRVELVEGLLYRKPMKKGAHSIASRESAAALSRLVSSKAYFVTREDPVRIPGRSGMPEPDISVVRGRSRDFIEQPDAGDVPLIVEVSDKTLAFDRTDKLGSYAGGGIPVYWIVNLVDRQVEVYTNPDPTGYQSSQVFKPGQEVPVVIDGTEVGRIPVSDILP
jgi:Uma2 family endonuclease